MKRGKLNYKLFFVIITLIVVLTLSLASCIDVNMPSWVDVLPSTSPVGSPEIQYIRLSVPCVTQAGQDWCGRACVTMVLKYYGSNVSLEEVSYAVDNYDGSWIDAYKDYCKSIGFIAKYCYLYADNVRYYLQEGMPIILNATHAFTLFGYDDIKEEFISYNPRTCTEDSLKYSIWGHISSFDDHWQENYLHENVLVQPCWVIYPK